MFFTASFTLQESQQCRITQITIALYDPFLNLPTNLILGIIAVAIRRQARDPNKTWGCTYSWSRESQIRSLQGLRDIAPSKPRTAAGQSLLCTSVFSELDRSCPRSEMLFMDKFYIHRKRALGVWMCDGSATMSRWEPPGGMTDT